MKEYLGGLALVVVIALGAFVLTRLAPVAPPVAPPVGAAGSEFSSRVTLLDGVSVGGTIMATSSTAATYTVTAAELSRAPQIINWTPNVNTTLSIGATSTLVYVPKVGDTAEIYLRNASTTLASTITLAAVDANTELQHAEATGGDVILNGTDVAKITLIHRSQFVVVFIFDEMIHN